MRLSIPLVLLAVLAPEAPKEAPAPAVPSGRLPVLGTVGDLPKEAERLVLEVDAKGKVTSGGKVLDLADLRAILVERADGDRRAEGAKASNLHVVLRADRDLPWQGAQWLMQECARPAVRVHRILFAARPEDGGEEGAMATFLPVDVRTAGPDDEVQLTLNMRLRISKGGDDAAPSDAAERIALFLGRDAALRGEIDASPAVPTGTVLHAVDAFLRSGVKAIVFRGTTTVASASVEAALAERPASEGRLSVHILDTRIPRPEVPAPMKPVSRVKGALAGILAFRLVAEPEVIPVEGR